MNKYILLSDYSAAYPEPACSRANPPCSIAQKAPRLFKKGEVIDGTPKFASVQCIKAPCPAGTTLVGVTTTDNLTIPMNVLSLIGINKEQAKDETRDPWTGGIEWNQVFNFRNLFWTVLIVYLIYLFLKHVLPLIKKSV